MSLPCGVDARRLCLIQTGGLAALVETNNHGADTERSDTTSLRVPLLHTSDVLGNIVNRNRVFDGESVRLSL